MEFKTPYVLVLIPIVLAVLLLSRRQRKEPSFTFSSTDILNAIGASWKSRFYQIPWILRLWALVLLLIALAGPRMVSQESRISAEGIDIVLALDVSGSMAAEDFTINGQRKNRLEIIKGVVADFIDQRPYDKISLVAFGSRAYTICPLTSDHAWLKANLDRVHLGIIEDGTAIGSGISSALLRLKKSQAKSRIVILLTDGVNNAGKIDPLVAAKTAQTLGIKVYTIGAGTKGLAPFPVTDMFGHKFYQTVQIDLNEDDLRQIADLTHAKYFRATDTESLRNIYKEIDRLEKTRIEEKGYKEYEELFGVFLISGLSVLLLELVLANTWLLRIP